jgi:hypothetical protein
MCQVLDTVLRAWSHWLFKTHLQELSLTENRRHTTLMFLVAFIYFFEPWQFDSRAHSP